jgi:hypothetical protein
MPYYPKKQIFWRSGSKMEARQTWSLSNDGQSISSSTLKNDANTNTALNVHTPQQINSRFYLLGKIDYLQNGGSTQTKLVVARLELTN